MAGNTKEKILIAALNLFAQNGYEATNIQSIADSVGIVKSALYRHFKSKEAIWTALLEKMTIYYDEHLQEVRDRYGVIDTTEELKSISTKLVDFTIHDEKIIRMRRIFTIEQYRNENICRLTNRYYLEKTEEYYEKIMKNMIEKGKVKKADPSLLAFEYVSPITLLIQWHDREPSKDKEIMKMIEKHIDHFIETYGIEMGK